MKAKLLKGFLFMPLVIWVICLAAGAAAIYRHELYLFAYPRIKPEFEWNRYISVSVSASSAWVEHGKERLRYRTIKISFPFEYAQGGCEFVYGAGVYGQAAPSGLPSLVTSRAVLKFKYDLKNRRCESKELVLADGLDESIWIQLIKVRIDPSEVVETPETEGVRLDRKVSSGKDQFTATQIPLPAADPFSREWRTRRNDKFSAMLPPGAAEPFVSPQQDLRSFILAELKKRETVCRTQNKCGSILAAVAEFRDQEVFDAFESARRAGIRVQVLTSFSFTDSGQFVKLSADEYPPWSWLRGNPYKLRLKLPMHAKFVVFDDDLVVSTNANFSFSMYYKSREISIIYRSAGAASIFREAFSLIRTGAFYPLRVDLRDNWALLLNADRPRGYAASSFKPYLQITSNEGVVSNAYGVLFALFDREQGRTSLVMSPISNSCAIYEKNRCLFDLIRDKAERLQIDLTLNAYFYLHDPNRLQYEKNMGLYWLGLDTAGGSHLEPQLEQIRKLFEKSPDQLRLSVMTDNVFSNHHERFALLGNDLTIAGSANFASPSSVNTVEVIRNKDINRRFRREIEGFGDLYFVVPQDKDSPSWRTAAGCEFVFEKDFEHPHAPVVLKEFDARQIVSAVREQFGVSVDGFKIVMPVLVGGLFSDNEKYLHMEFSSQGLSGNKKIKSPSSFFCLRNDTLRQNYVVQVRE